MKKSIEKLKIGIVGTWYSDGQASEAHQIDAIFDITLYNSLVFKALDKIVFYKDGYFKVNDTGTLKRYEITIYASSFDYEGRPFWTYHVKLDGIDYFAFFKNGSLSLGYSYVTGSWSQLLKKEK